MVIPYASILCFLCFFKKSHRNALFVSFSSIFRSFQIFSSLSFVSKKNLLMFSELHNSMSFPQSGDVCVHFSARSRHFSSREGRVISIAVLISEDVFSIAPVSIAGISCVRIVFSRAHGSMVTIFRPHLLTKSK